MNPLAAPAQVASLFEMKSESFGCAELMASLLERSAEVVGRADHMARLFK